MRIIDWRSDDCSADLTVSRGTGTCLDPVYFVAVCALAGVDLPHLDTSVLCPAKVDLVKHYVGFAKWAQSLDKVVADRNSQILSAQQEIESLSDELARRSEWALRLEAELKDERAKLLASKFARIFAILRQDSRRRGARARQAGRVLKACLRVAKREGRGGIKS